ncbi:MAG TPA: hypothetical protein VJ656_13100 [Pyrinomonadaceae bacterium]|nr:hypothetical protein [Pyrinomonadaceae bacterium]
MKEHVLNRSFDASLPGTQPHFDDERTVQSARRVVPLEKFEAKERHRRYWLLGGAFALAMMLGAASALLASYLKLRNVPTVASEISEIETPAPPVAAVAEPVEGELPISEHTTDAGHIDEALEPVVTPKRAPVRRPVTIPSNTDLIRPRIVREGDEADELERIREAVLIEEWQERRARRVARRERRNRVDHHDRDLSNLDEIFEGPRRRRP